MFLFLSKNKLNFWCNADISRIQPVKEPESEVDVPAERAVGRAVLQDLDMAETLTELQKHIEGLTFGIPYFRIEEIPMQL